MFKTSAEHPSCNGERKQTPSKGSNSTSKGVVLNCISRHPTRRQQGLGLGGVNCSFGVSELRICWNGHRNRIPLAVDWGLFALGCRGPAGLLSTISQHSQPHCCSPNFCPLVGPFADFAVASLPIVSIVVPFWGCLLGSLL